MEIKSLSATFGRLKNQTLSLSPGLNLIEAANESGKTTWMAFLRVMLYGLSTRDRSPLADKHRYMPWDGSPMQGHMDLVANGQAVTITRATVRAAAPMGAFSACLTNTATPVPALTSTTLGDTLLGIPQEVFERSAFIRQSGISIGQNPALEQRIAALITTGEEDSSYTDAADRLRRQLNRRRYHKIGLLPQLESEIASLENTLAEISTLESALHSLENEHDTLRQQENYLRHQLSLCDAAENARQLSRLNDARSALTAAKALHDTTAARVAQLPSKAELTRIAGELVSVQAMEQSVQTARARMQKHAAALNHAEKNLSTHPFAPQTPDEAARSLVTDAPHSRFFIWGSILALFCGALLFLLLHLVVRLPLPLAAGIALLTAGTAWIGIGLCTVRRQKAWETKAAEKYSEARELLAAYTILYEAAERERADFRAASETYRALAADYQLHLEHALSLVSRFHPAATAAEARRAAEQALSLHAAFDEADHQYRQARLRFEVLSETAPQTPNIPTEVPELSRTEAENKLEVIASQLAGLSRSIHTTQGKIGALGDPLLLRAELDGKCARHAALQKEFDALTLAGRVLSDANTSLQTRFSPALGEKTANIFTKLTQGKYNKVLLDRTLTPFAQEDGDIMTHTAAVLSQGTADQLYLAVRLAICDTILPTDRCVPIFLDDALVTFDDNRMAAALDYLVELSHERQILLFTCQQRELNYLRTAHPGKYHTVTLS